MWEDDFSVKVSSPSYLYTLGKEHFDLVEGVVKDCSNYDTLVFVKELFLCNVYGDGNNLLGQIEINKLDSKVFEFSKRSITYRPLECLNYNLAY